MKAQQNSALSTTADMFRWLSAVWLSIVLIGLSGVSVRPDWHRAVHEAGQVQIAESHPEVFSGANSLPCPELPDSGADSPHFCAIALLSSGAVNLHSLSILPTDWAPAFFVLPETIASDLPQSFLIGRCSGRSPPLAASDLCSAPCFA